MKNTFRFICIASALALFTASARAGWQGSATATYDVKATMDSFTGNAASEPIAIADGATEFPVTFLISKMETGKKKRDVEMQHMFGAEKYPEITGKASAESLLRLQADGELPVSLTIAGVTKELPAKISKVSRSEGSLSFAVSMEISLKSFGLKPPSIMKIINVGDIVNVTAIFSLAPDKAPAVAP